MAFREPIFLDSAVKIFHGGPVVSAFDPGVLGPEFKRGQLRVLLDEINSLKQLVDIDAVDKAKFHHLLVSFRTGPKAFRGFNRRE